jgi:hypothetical protein
MEQLVDAGGDFYAASSLLALVLNLAHAMAVDVVATALAACALGPPGLPPWALAVVVEARRMARNEEQLLMRVEGQGVVRRRVWVVGQRRRGALHPAALSLSCPLSFVPCRPYPKRIAVAHKNNAGKVGSNLELSTS